MSLVALGDSAHEETERDSQICREAYERHEGQRYKNWDTQSHMSIQKSRNIKRHREIWTTNPLLKTRTCTERKRTNHGRMTKRKRRIAEQ